MAGGYAAGGYAIRPCLYKRKNGKYLELDPLKCHRMRFLWVSAIMTLPESAHTALAG
jgi:hypothetical protein